MNKKGIWREIAGRLPQTRLDCIFDVGANVGQTVGSVLQNEPQAHVWSFEPVLASFKALEAGVADADSVRCFNLALSDHPGSALMTARGTSVGNRIITKPVSGQETQEVTVTTGDLFCEEQQIDHIDLLKIDTEGHELEVLRGFQRLLTDFRVSLIDVEAGMHWGNTKHVPFERLKGMLEPLGYMVFLIHQQTPEFDGRPHLRRVNALFVSTPTIEANRRQR